MLAKGNFQRDEEANREFSSESQFHAVVWGWAIPKVVVTEANEKPEDELSTETRANVAAGLGLCQSIFGSIK